MNAVDDKLVDIFIRVKICLQSHYADNNADNSNGLKMILRWMWMAAVNIHMITMMMIFKVDVNGSGEHPIFKHLKAALPLPQVFFNYYSICMQVTFS